jgi:hypothetical protein
MFREMTRQAASVFWATLLAVTAFFWTAAGETSDPLLFARELPLEVVTDCTLSADVASCQGGDEPVSRWVGRTARGDLFLVTLPHCPGNGCRGWLVEKTETGAATLLSLTGHFGLRRGARGYPAVEVRTELSELHSAYASFEWTGERYVRTSSRLVYRVNGRECGTREECQATAAQALDKRQTDEAVRIWERVHGVSWI